MQCMLVNVDTHNYLKVERINDCGVLSFQWDIDITPPLQGSETIIEERTESLRVGDQGEPDRAISS